MKLRKVARLKMQYVASRLAERVIALAASDAALDYVLSQSYDYPTCGAWPIRGWLEMRVVKELSKILIREEIDKNSTVSINAAAGGKWLS
uniref:Clp ATPase C-terminal domain-containing protein n=2 Tax=Kalanchoe fedtschenkoi TaxID=63787 RepID=A0A7N0UHA3_KALFE